MKHLDARLILAVLLPVLTACQALGPALTSAIVAFGQDLLSTAAFNYRPQYAESLSNLLLAMAETSTGMQFTALPENYYVVRREQIEAQREAERYRQQQAYAGDPYAQETRIEDPYADQSYGQEPYDQEPYDQETYSPEPYPQDPDAPVFAGTPGAPPPAQTDVYGGPAVAAGYPAVRSPFDVRDPTLPSQPLVLDVALLAQVRGAGGAIGLKEVADGDVLHDGGADPAAGDKIKISFRAGCACYLYVLGVDATGWVTKIHPAAGEAVGPLTAERDYLLPAGDTWWALDQYQGVEQIYFLLSARRRPDIEAALAALPDVRPGVPAGYRAVREPAVVPVRGLVQVQSPAPTTVPVAGTAARVTPASFAAALDSTDLVVTRWFDHR